MSLSTRVLEGAEPSGHILQLYGSDERVLIKNVSRYLKEGLRLGDALIVIATAAHREAFATHLKLNCAGAEEEGRIVWLDAEETLAQFMADGQPQWARFERTIQSALDKARGHAEHPGVRAYGEMVGVLWKSGQRAAAIRLEKFWNRLLEGAAFRLYCGYPIDVFSAEFRTAGVEAILCAHTHLVPAGEGGEVRWAVQLAMDDILGPEACGAKALVHSRYRFSGAKISSTEAMILSLRETVPAAAEEILERARGYYHSEKRLLRFGKRHH